MPRVTQGNVAATGLQHCPQLCRIYAIHPPIIKLTNHTNTHTHTLTYTYINIHKYFPTCKRICVNLKAKGRAHFQTKQIYEFPTFVIVYVHSYMYMYIYTFGVYI